MVCEGPSLCHNIGAGSDASSPNPMVITLHMTIPTAATQFLITDQNKQAQ
jgi:hypothetical protein